MTNIIGQAKLLSVIETYITKQQLPKTLLLLGSAGCGKHTITKYIAEKFELAWVELDENVDANELNDYLFSTIDTLYVINLNKFSEKQQNQFLKFIEEPSKSVYIALISNSEANVLNTVLNRCTKLTFDCYTKEQIEQITNTKVNELAFEIFQTPGKLLNLTDKAFNDILSLADSVVSKINYATYPNTLVISTKINYKDIYDKVDFNLFLDAVEYLAFEDFKNKNNKQSLTIFLITVQFKQYATQTNLIKETLMINYLTALWEAVQNDIK